jgi:hypothetical protein
MGLWFDSFVHPNEDDRPSGRFEQALPQERREVLR